MGHGHNGMWAFHADLPPSATGRWGGKGEDRAIPPFRCRPFARIWREVCPTIKTGWGRFVCARMPSEKAMPHRVEWTGEQSDERLRAFPTIWIQRPILFGAPESRKAPSAETERGLRGSEPFSGETAPRSSQSVSRITMHTHQRLQPFDGRARDPSCIAFCTEAQKT